MIGRLEESQQALLDDESIALTKRIAERYARVFPEHEADIESAAFFGAVRAAASFKDCGSPWDRWSSMCIRGEVKNFLDSGYLRRKTRLDYAVMNLLEDRSERIRIAEANDALDHLVSLLPARFRQLIVMVYKLGWTPAEAGRELGFSRDYGTQMHSHAIQHLRELMAA